MAAKDAVTKEYMRDAKVFGMHLIFCSIKGRPVIDPNRTPPMDPVKIVLPYGEDGRWFLFRDTGTISST